MKTVLALLVLAGPALAQPALSQRYTVQVGSERLPILADYEKWAEKLDRDRDRWLSFDEMSATARELPGGLRVDLDDYVLGMGREFSGTLSSYTAGYPSAAEIEAQLQALAGSHPNLVELVRLGTTPQGRPVTAVRVGRHDAAPRPGIAVVAQQHAREWMAHQVALASLRDLLEEPSHADLLEHFEFWFVPLANPDGYEYSRTVDPMWRKNRRGDGVDLNRNFAADYRRDGDTVESYRDDWGASDAPGSAQYRGERPASEPETRYLQTLLDKPEMVGVVDVHGFGCKIVLPNARTNAPDTAYRSSSQAMLEALGEEYEVVRYEKLYPITGHLAAYADQRGLVGITLEVGKAFQPNPARIREVTERASRGVLAFARAMMKV